MKQLGYGAMGVWSNGATGLRSCGESVYHRKSQVQLVKVASLDKSKTVGPQKMRKLYYGWGCFNYGEG